MVLCVPPVTVTDYDFAQHAHMPPVVEEDMLRLRQGGHHSAVKGDAATWWSLDAALHP